MIPADENFLKIFDNHREIMLLTEEGGGKIIRANSASLKFYGYEEKILTGMTIRDLNTLESGAVTDTERNAGSDFPGYYRNIQRKADGSFSDVDVFSFRCESGGRKIICSIIFDLSSERHSNEYKSEPEEILKNIFKYSATGKAIVDKNKKFIEVNPAFTKILGYTDEELRGKTFADITHPDDIGKGLELVGGLEAGKADFGTQEKRYIHKDGHIIWANISISVIRDSEGKPKHIVAQIQDITDKKNIETLLEEGNNLYKTVVDLSDNGIVLQSRTGKILTWNKCAEKVFGLKESEVVGIDALEGVWDCYYEDGSPYPPEEHPSMVTFKTGKPCRGANMLVRNTVNDKFFWITINTSPLFRKGDDLPYAVAVSFTNITEQKKYLDELKRSEENFKLLVNNANEAIYVIQNRKIVFANRMSEKISGYTQSELIGTEITDIVNEFEVDNIYARHLKLLSGEIESDSYTISIVTKDRVKRTLLVNAVRIDYNGIPATLSLAADITARVQIQELFRSRLEIIENSEGMQVKELLQRTIDEAERITDSRIGFFHFVNEDEGIVTSQQWSTKTKEFYCRADSQEKHYPIEEAGIWADCAREKEVKIYNEFDRQTDLKGLPEGHSPLTRMVTAPVTRGGKVVAILGVGNKEINYDEYDVTAVSQLADLAWDLTEKKLSQEELKISENKLRKMNEEKDRFFSIIAHDLRSPFTAFLGITEIMSENIYNMTLQEIRQYLLKINSEASNLFNLLNNLLEWSMSQRNLKTVRKETINLRGIVKNSIEVMKENSERKEIKIDLSIPDDRTVYVDRSMFETVVRNLISNAIKFTKRGGSIRVFFSGSDDGYSEICFEDSGIGMDEETIQKVFNIAEKTKRKGTEGELSTGLGLPICKDLLEKNGGGISIKSETDKGTKIFVTVPSGNEE
ncbi:MAG TPA: PAS domain S-box protein [Ignavibacteria bacterium]|nr:PAS domain S-box protein [Ignavibacteria bacterium]